MPASGPRAVIGPRVGRQTLHVRRRVDVVRAPKGEAMGRILLLGGHARQPKRREPPGPLEPRPLERSVLDPLLQTRGLVQRGLQQTRQGRVGTRAGSASRHRQWVGRGRRVEMQL
jgi:hypothetical protein